MTSIVSIDIESTGLEEIHDAIKAAQGIHTAGSKESHAFRRTNS